MVQDQAKLRAVSSLEDVMGLRRMWWGGGVEKRVSDHHARIPLQFVAYKNRLKGSLVSYYYRIAGKFSGLAKFSKIVKVHIDQLWRTHTT